MFPSECLRCPVCGAALADFGPSAGCPAGHSFDFARPGYLNLTLGGGHRPRRADTAEMVAARSAFLTSDRYAPVVAAVAAAAAAVAAPGVLAELGSGTGCYLAAAHEGGGGRAAVGIDLSKAAAAHASRLHPEAGFVVADVEEGIPLLDGVAGVVLSVFAPRPAAELGRVVAPGGELVAVFAGRRHLQRLRERFGLLGVGERKLERLTARLAPWFQPVSAEPLEYGIELDQASAHQLALMGPSAWHGIRGEEAAGAFADLVSVVVARFRRGAAPVG